MKSIPNYPSLIIGFIILLCLFGCNQNEKYHEIEDGAEITIRTTDGLYLCADQHKNNQLVADRKQVVSWELFNIEFDSNHSFSLRASNHTHVGVSDYQGDLLSSGFSEDDRQARFKLTKSDSAGFFIQDYRNKFIGLDTNKVLRANQENLAGAAVFYLEKVPEKTLTHFSINQLIPLILGLLFIFISLLVFQFKEGQMTGILLLALGGFCVRFFTALLDPHLNLWDEQFHALVAKNMMDDPFSPMLFKNHVLPYDPNNWMEGHIWLHKQPLFLWQMALSLKLFGINTLALRLPSMIMSTVVMLFIYRIGELSINKTAGFFGALLFTLANFTLEITAGTINTDHNDVAFLFYVSASIWAWVEYEKSITRKKHLFLCLIGFLSGCAILVKWLPGLLVFSGWGISILLSKERRNSLVHFRNLLVALAIAVVTFLPWRLYINSAFPAVSKYEFDLNSRHFFEVLENHGGDFWWHFKIANEIYGVDIYLLLFSVGLLFIAIKDKTLKTAFISFIFIIYIFFGIAATKMIAFTYCVSFLIYLAFGVTIDRFMKTLILNPEYFPKKIHKIFYTTTILLLLSYFNMNINQIENKHIKVNQEEDQFLFNRIRTTPVIQNLSKQITDMENYVIFNCIPEDRVPIQFFNDVVSVYSIVPDSNTYADLKRRKYKIAIFDDRQLPAYLKADHDVIKIQGYWNSKN